MLRLGSHGDGVKHLQRSLQPYVPGLKADGFYGPQTERAVRLAQRRNGVYPPDGIAGPITMAVLNGPSHQPATSAPFTPHKPPSTPYKPISNPSKGDPGPLKPTIDPPRGKARTSAMPDGTARNVLSLVTSPSGLDFIIGLECLEGVSNHLHHPTAASGVTLGPGYDMKQLSPERVESDLVSIGVDQKSARVAANGSGLSGDQADKFVSENIRLIFLSKAQEALLLNSIVGRYEAIVRRGIHVPLHQYEFDALVSFVYNPGHAWPSVAAQVNKSQ